MPSYLRLLQLLIPIFGILAAGITFRRIEWLTEEADKSLLNVLIKFLIPCLIFDNVLDNAALREPSNLLFPPLVGFVSVTIGIGIAFWVGRLLGMERGTGLRTFAFSAGIPNYAYIPIPIVTMLFGKESLGVLFMYNVGCETALWSVSALVLSGLSMRDSWRKILNPPLWGLLVALALNLLGLSHFVPEIAHTIIHMCAQCAIPMGLILIGATLADFVLSEPLRLLDPRVTPVACVLRMCVFPLIMLLAARFLPVGLELKRIMIVQAPMPAAVSTMLIVRLYGGRLSTAAQVVVATNVLGILLIPLWLRLGFGWAIH